MASAALVVVTVLAAVAVLALKPAFLFGEAVAQAPVSSGSSPFLTTAPAGATPTAAAPATSFPTASSATDRLTEQADLDRAAVESVTGWWVPQLSSKRSGTVDGGISYDSDRILSHYQGLAVQYPGAALLWSGDWPVFKGSDYWVVVVAQPFSTAAEANAWCDAQGFGADDCLAKKLSHSGGPQGTTVPRS
ncbi:hypothetical protein EV383_6098 [Pseudonocardia sediminis]|uniref:Uncharacterized protein n=1 Tax=Pseudonocardia sediminis TaxID=1397368 RepID=A0A4Q7V8K9_PSEST|nr:hypothetical protein EV383_6098 [Pseudonocardia sediminis]